MAQGSRVQLISRFDFPSLPSLIWVPPWKKKRNEGEHVDFFRFPFRGGAKSKYRVQLLSWSQGSPTSPLGPQGPWDPRGLGKRPRASDRCIRSQVGSVGWRPGWHHYTRCSRLPRPDPARYTVICLGKELSPPGIREGTLAGVPLCTPRLGYPLPREARGRLCGQTDLRGRGVPACAENGRNACIRTPPSPFP